jgi:protein SCO1/2
VTKTAVILAATLGVFALVPTTSAEEQGEISGRSVYNLGETWTNQDGKTATLSSFRGKPVVAAMGYTTCKDICPAIVADMMWIERHLPSAAADQVRFAFFSLDPEADTPERLKLYAGSHGLDHDHWTLLTASDEDAVRELAATFGVAYRRDRRGGFDHAAVISLLDSKGEIVFQWRGTQAAPEELMSKLRELLSARN